MFLDIKSCGVIALLMLLQISSSAQCDPTVYTTDGYCGGQYASFEIPTPEPGYIYDWYTDSLATPADFIGSGTTMVSPTTYPAGTDTIALWIKKRLEGSYAPSFVPTSANTPPANNAPSTAYSVNADFKLTEITVALHMQQTTSTYNITLDVGGTNVTHSFQVGDPGVSPLTGINQAYLVTIPMDIDLVAGDAGTVSIGSTSANGFVAYPAASVANVSNSVIDITPSTANVWGQTVKTGFFNWGAEIQCTSERAKSGEITDPLLCCTPVGVTPLITTVGGTNIIESPVSETLTASGSDVDDYFVWYSNGVATGDEGYGVNSISINSHATYSVLVVDSAQFKDNFSCYTTDDIAIQPKALTIPDDQTICIGDPVDLFAIGATGNIQWLPSAEVANPNSASTIAYPTLSTTFQVTADVVFDNLVTNGGFEGGNSGFTSDYNFESNPSQTNDLQGTRYAIGTVATGGANILKCNDDHGPGTGNFLYAKGPFFGSEAVWSQTVTVDPNTEYEFSAWLAGIHTTSMANLQLLINGAPVTSATLGGSCDWTSVKQLWNSGTATSATLSIVETTNNGRDFAIDDIAFGVPGRQTASFDVTVDDCFFIDATTTNICEGDSIPISATTNGFFIGWTEEGGGTASISDPTSQDTYVKPTATTRYIAEAGFTIGNLVTNPSFEQGTAADFQSQTAGFTTDLGYGQNSVGPNNFGIGPNPELLNSYFLPIGDHTTGTGNMMILDAGGGTDNAYSTVVEVENGKQYAFSVWIANVNWQAEIDATQSNPPELEFVINGTPLDPIIFPDLTSDWFQFTQVWTSNTDGPITIKLGNQNVDPGGNDFAIDDVVFAPLFGTTKYDTIEVIACSPPAIDTIIDTCVLALPFSYDLTVLEDHVTGVGVVTNPPSVTGWYHDTLLTMPVASPGAITITSATDKFFARTEGGDFGGFSIAKATFNLHLPPTGSITATVDTFLTCSVNSQELTATPSTGVSYDWSNNATISAITVNEGGTYTVTLTDDVTGCTSIVEQIITVDTLKPHIQTLSQIDFCLKDTVDINTLEKISEDAAGTELSAADLTYSFFEDATLTTPLTDFNQTPAVTSSIYMEVVYDVNGCRDTAQIDLEPLPLPTVTMAPGTESCGPGQVEVILTNGPANGTVVINPTVGVTPADNITVPLDAAGEGSILIPITGDTEVNLISVAEDGYDASAPNNGACRNLFCDE